MDWKAALTLIVAIVVAGLTYVYNRRLAQRKDKLDRVNRQLSELYGPLWALSSATQISWAAFRSRYRPDVHYWDSIHPPSAEEAETWRLWITFSFMPLNRRMTDAIVSHADLIEDDYMPECFLQLLAHVTSYEALVSKWAVGDVSEHLAILPFPREELPSHVYHRFSELKLEQQRLLGSLALSPDISVSG